MHRAVSPSNVLIAASGELRLANPFLARPTPLAPLAASDRVPEAVRPLLAAALDDEPGHRPASAAQRTSAFRDVLRHELRTDGFPELRAALKSLG